MHDPRIGRFFATDPLEKTYPWYTPYQFSGNKVIQYVELEGLEEGPSQATAYTGTIWGASTPSNSTTISTISSVSKFIPLPIFRAITIITSPSPIELIPEVNVSAGQEGLSSGLGFLSDNIHVNVNTFNSKATTRAEILSATLEDRKQNTDVGSYTVEFSNGKKYHGKGNFGRAVKSALEKSVFGSIDDKKTVIPTSIDWTKSTSDRDAFKDEHTRLQTDKNDKNPQGYTNTAANYNVKQSPGYAYKLQDGESVE